MMDKVGEWTPNLPAVTLYNPSMHCNGSQDIIV